MKPLLSRLLPVLAALLAFGAAAAPARAWWNNDWPLRRMITLDASASGAPISDAIGNSPVLLRLHDGDFTFAAAKSDGSDLRFVAADDKTLLPYHIEKFDTLLDEAFVWVSVPGIKPGAKTTFWLYYGNGGQKATKVEDAKGTYDSDTALVYHFNERGQPAYDFSGQGNNAENAGPAAEGSMIGGGLRLDGKTGVNLPSSPSLAWVQGSAMTWSAWVKFGPPAANAVFFGRREGSQALMLGADQGVPFVAVTYQGSIVRSSGGAPVSPNSWHHLAFVASGGSIAVYLDGEHYGDASAPLPSLTAACVLGGSGGVGAANVSGFIGEIDELEISRTARPAGWIKFAALEQGPDGASKLLAVGENEQPSSWFGFLTKGYIGVIIGSLTVDGWVVIGLLAIMSVISWSVMISKARFLTKLGKSNEAFLREWRRVAQDLSAIEKEDEPEFDPGAPAKAGSAITGHGGSRNSPLYHIYHLGMEEIGQRLGRNQPGYEGGTKKVISERSIEAIRATLDAGFVRESQKLTSQIVLLTIAISGGPFLGLLGTVVGVMITFAAVAQAGDVNVNAIAPGIAAALAATVAGLAVAIPALFGYNYLLARIKAATSDMQVFIDEFITRLAEFYRDERE